MVSTVLYIWSTFQSTLPVGGATVNRNTYGVTFLFQSTLPVGGATWETTGGIGLHIISIHAPRGGSD